MSKDKNTPLFPDLEKAPEPMGELFKKIIKYHFDWSPEEPTQRARNKQVVELIREHLRKQAGSGGRK